MERHEFINIQKKIIPEIIDLMELRYNILLFIKANQPIGRRNLAQELSVSERQVRNEIDFLLMQNFVEVERQGIHLTKIGEEIINQLKGVIYSYKNLEDLVVRVKEKLKIKKVFIISGDCQKNKLILEFMGKKVGEYILSIIKANSVIGLTGGSSVASVAKNISEINHPKVTVLPARGGIGKSHSTQANSVVSTLANKLNAKNEMLHIPDNVDKEILNALKSYPDIKGVFDKYELIDIMIFGIGKADVMARRRNLPEYKMKELISKNAIGEAFGYYFDADGNVVEPSSSVGISLEDYKRIPNIIAIAGGKDKANAIIATCKINKDLVLVTDESAAVEILKT